MPLISAHVEVATNFHAVLGENASGRVSITNSEIDGSSTWSATCDGHHYWAVYLTGCK
jgi:pectin lyase